MTNVMNEVHMEILELYLMGDERLHRVMRPVKKDAADESYAASAQVGRSVESIWVSIPESHERLHWATWMRPLYQSGGAK